MRSTMVLLVSVSILSACAATWRLTGSSVAPAAEGHVTTKEGDNGNTRLEIKVKHLAAPDKITPGAAAYAVWVTPDGNGRPINIGTLRINEDLEGSLETVTPLRSFTLTVTAEPIATPASPTGPVVLSVRIEPK